MFYSLWDSNLVNAKTPPNILFRLIEVAKDNKRDGASSAFENVTALSILNITYAD